MERDDAGRGRFADVAGSFMFEDEGGAVDGWLWGCRGRSVRRAVAKGGVRGSGELF